MSAQEFATITVQRFRAPDGRPTCCIDATSAGMCVFLRTSRMGLQWDCALSPRGQGLDDYAGDGMGYLQPSDDCPVWGGK